MGLGERRGECGSLCGLAWRTDEGDWARGPARDNCGILTRGYWRRRTGAAFAAVTAPTRVSAQLLLHLVANARWSDEVILPKCVNW
jgi:hypothetical protein